MKITFEYEKEIKEIENAINRMPNLLEKQERKMLSQIGRITRKYVIQHLHRYREIGKRLKSRRNYDKTKPYIQMDDDVKVKVSKTKQGDLYVSVKGGKYTGYKWHFLNDGTRNPNGTVHTQATHFMDVAFLQSGKEIEAVLADTLREVASDGED